MVAPGMDISMARSTSGCTATCAGGNCVADTCDAKGVLLPKACAKACAAELDIGPLLPSGSDGALAFACAASGDADAVTLCLSAPTPVTAFVELANWAVGEVLLLALGVVLALICTSCSRLFTSTSCVMYCMGSVCVVGSWFWISVTSRERKSLAVITALLAAAVLAAEELLLEEVGVGLLAALLRRPELAAAAAFCV